ncbi:MAG: hypothetical protein J3K34DRAFT_167284 [Monoraphidium minutum]|nr:MAG: hypothetical protein J3K34DRAFT_167284 [Monoraphidium minutum]
MLCARARVQAGPGCARSPGQAARCAAPTLAPRARSGGVRRWRSAPRAAAPGPGGAAADEPQPVMLNWHTVWMQSAGAARPVLFGESYVLMPDAPREPPAAAAPPAGLVPWRRPGGLSVRPPPPAGGGLVSAARLRSAPLVALPVGETGIVPYSGDPVVLRGSGYIEAEAVDAEVLPPGEDDAPPPLPPTTTALVPHPASARATGIVPRPAGAGGEAGAGADAEAEGVYESFNTFSPRRGHKIKFTCRRCGGTSIRPINIQAWREGTVFARCGKCGVTHKLVDNLRLFHEMSGPAFDNPLPALDPSVPLPPSLRLRLDELGAAGGAAGGVGVGGYDGFRGWAPRGAERGCADEEDGGGAGAA